MPRPKSGSSLINRFRKDLLSAVLLAVLTVAYFWKIIFTNDYHMLNWQDNLTQIYPWYSFAGRSFKSRILPLWNPYQYSGYPFLGEGLAGVFYPLNVVLFLIPAKTGLSIRAFEGMVILHVFLAAIFMFALLRRLRLSPFSSLVGALVFAFDGFLLSKAINFVPMAYGYVWIPLAFLCFNEAIINGRWVWTLGAGLSLGISLLAGHIQFPLYTALTLLGFAICQGVARYRKDKRSRDFISPLFAFGLCLVVALGIAALQILPSLEYGRHALRWVGGAEPLDALAKIPYSLATKSSYPPRGIASLLSPWLLGIFEGYAYVGILPLLLAILSVMFRRNFYTLFFLGLALIFFALALGSNSVVYGLAYCLIPWLDKARTTSRAIYMLHFAMAALAAFGADFLASPIRKRDRKGFLSFVKYVWVVLGGACLVIFFLLLQFWLHSTPGEEAQFWLQSTQGEAGERFSHLFFFLILLASSAVLVLARGRGLLRRRSLRTLVIILIVFDLFSYGTSYLGLKAETDLHAEKYYRETDVINFLRGEQGYFRIENHENALPINFGDVFGLFGTFGYSALALKDYFEFRSLQWTPPSRIHDLLNVRYVVSRKQMEGLRLVFEGKAKVYENETHLPRAWVVHEAEVIKDKKLALQRLQNAAFAPERSVILSEDFDTGRLERGKESACRIVDYSLKRIELDVDMAGNGFLVLSEVYYPGWKAYVDGRKSRIYKADLVLRAVYLDRGHHRVTLVYDPLWFKVGVGITGVTLLSVALAVLWALGKAMGLKKHVASVIATIFKIAVFLPLLFLLPGYVTLRALKVKGLDWMEVLFLSAFSSILLGSWLGLLLAEVALFSLWSLLLLLLVYSVGMAVVFGVRFTWSDIPRPRSGIGYWLLGIIVIASLLFFRPFESILGTSDAGVYLGMGANIARTGAIRARDPLLADLTGGLENELLYSYRFPRGSELMRFFGDGVRIWDIKQGVLFSQQNHLYQVWVAIFHSIFGMRTGVNPLAPLDLLGILEHFSRTPIFLYVTPFFGLLGVIALYFAGKALFNDRVGLLASFLLAINAAQMWFSRWAMAEVLTQFLVFGALYCFALYVKTAQHSFGLLAGFGLGLAVFSKAEGIFLIVPVVLYFVYLRFTRKLRPGHLYFFAPFAALLLHWLIHSLLLSRTQFLAIGRALPYFSSIGPLAIGGAVLVAVLVILAFLKVEGWRLKVGGRWIRPAVAFVIVLLALYAYFIRPNAAVPQMVYYHPAGGMIRTYNEENLVRLGWYVTPLGLLLALGGLVAMILRERDEGAIFFLGVAMLYSFVFIHSALVNPIHIYWIRRYVTAVIPSIMLFISYGLFQISNFKPQTSNPWPWTGRILAVGLTLALAASLLQTSLALAGQRPYQGAVAQMNRLAEQIGDGGVVILESPLIGDPFALPLTYLYGKDSFVLQGRTPDSRRFFDLVERWRQRGKEVFYIAYDGLTRVRSDDYVFSPVGEVVLDIPLPETSFEHLPQGLIHHPYQLEIYKIEPAWKREAPIYPFSLDVGRFDYGYLLSGFHARESSDGRWYRWMGETAEVILPWVPEGRSLILSLTVGSQRPAGVEPAEVSLYLNEHLLDRFALGNEFKTHTVVVPPELVADPRAKTALLRLETNTWVPAEAGLEDVRKLGIVLDHIELDKAP